MNEQLINQPLLLQDEAKYIFQLMFNLGDGVLWFPFHGGTSFMPNETLAYVWPNDTSIGYTRNPQHFNNRVPNPRLWFTDLHVKNVNDIDWGESSRLGAPSTEIKTSQAVTLYPGDSTSLKISGSFTKTESQLESAKLSIQNSLKARVGGSASLVGGELSSQVTAEYMKQFTDTETTTEGVEQAITVTNTTKDPFVVHLEATRTVDRERRSAFANLEFDYTINLTALHTGRRKGEVTYVWGNKEQFLNSLRGLENDSVGAGDGEESISSRARRKPQSGLAFPTYNRPLDFSFEYDRVVDLKVRQVRTDLNGNPL